MAARRILLVEGLDDEHVIKHICGTRALGMLDEVKALGGIDPLLETFPVQLKASQDGDILGVVVDADVDLPARWQSLRDRLLDAGYASVPAAPTPDGTILDAPSGTILPRVGIWLMPNNQVAGILEDFLALLVPANSLLFDHVKSSVAAIPAGERRFSVLDEPKAIIHNWLAWQKDPGKPLGTAITAKYLDPAAIQADELASWLKRLFFS